MFKIFINKIKSLYFFTSFHYKSRIQRYNLFYQNYKKSLQVNLKINLNKIFFYININKNFSTKTELLINLL
jgi:hypothetical protein